MKEAKEPITAYHWIVVIIASLGWLFDCMDQRLFALSRESAIASLLGPDATAEAIKSGLMTATTWMILGWATGGIIFGILSDRWGRVKTMAATLLLYSVFTGLSGFSQGIFDFMVYRFLVGLGVGGMFGAATTLVAESVPSRLRAPALGALQALATVGNMMGSGISLFVPPGSPDGLFGYEGWRSLFFFGIIPAVLVVPMVLLLKEPKAWLNLKSDKKKSEKNVKSGSMAEMFGHKTWRKNAIIGLLLGVSGMIGLWGIGFFSPELISEALKGEKQDVIDQVRGQGTILFDIGAFLGMSAFTFVATLVCRRVAFLIFLILSMMGFAQLSLFAGYSIYFPELFPTRLRGTGVGFCYNTVRYLAAPAPILLAYLSTTLSFREGASLMACVYVLGIVALIWAPETKDKELPE